MAQDNLRDFLTRLATDEKYYAEFTTNPGATMSAANLTAKEQQVVLSNDPEALRMLLGDEAFAAANIKTSLG